MERYGHILIRPEAGNLTSLRMLHDAIVIRNGKPARYSELKPSDSIQVKYDARNREVISIHASGS